jgi:hypothetical protein
MLQRLAPTLSHYFYKAGEIYQIKRETEGRRERRRKKEIEGERKR